jgi:hypothetical protein
MQYFWVDVSYFTKEYPSRVSSGSTARSELRM